MCWFPFFKSSKRRKKPASKRDSLSEKSTHDDRSERRRGRAQSHQAQSAQYNTVGAVDPLRSHKPHLRVDVPDRPHRSVRELQESSSTEMLLNPRPERSRQNRQRHHRSTTTLRGRGAKRDPPVKAKRKPPGQTKKMPSSRSAQKQEWQRVPSPSSTSTSSRKRRRQRETQQQAQQQPQDYSHYYPDTHTQTNPYYESEQYRQYYEQYRQYYQQQQQYYAQQYQYQQSTSYQQPTRSRSRQPRENRTRTRERSRPNTSARRAPDGRFAVRAATNNALENIRREAFTSSPPHRTWTAHGVAVETTQTPFNWDCVTESSGSGRRTERREHRRRR